MGGVSFAVNPRPPERPSTWEQAKPLALALLLAVLGLYAVQLLIDIRRVLLLLFVSALFAAAMSRPAATLEQRGVPRGVAVALVQGLALAVLGLAAWLVVPPLVGQLSTFASDIPDYIDRFHRLRSSYESLRHDYPALGSFDQEVAALADRLGSFVGNRLVNLPLRTAELLFDLLTVYAIATLMVMRQEKMLHSSLRLVHPDRRRRAEMVILKIWVRLGAYVRAKVIVMIVIGTLMYLCLLALGVPFAVPLAIIVAFGEVIPAIGPWIGRAPLLLVAATQGWVVLGLTFLASFILENLKAYVISPHVEGQQLEIDPLLVLVAVITGGALMGAAGAFIAVPAAATLQVLWEELLVPWRLSQFEDDEGGPGRGEHDVSAV
jgi:predicted PurR-regulated permease PerM